MKCDFSIDLLNGYLDNELDEKERRMVENHLKTCACCQQVLEELTKIDKTIQTQAFEEPSRDFIFNLNRRVVEKVGSQPRFSIFRYVPVFAPAAVAILLLIVLLNIGQQERLVGINSRVIYAETPLTPKLELQMPELLVTEKADFVRKKEGGESKGYAAKASKTSPEPSRAESRDEESANVGEYEVQAPMAVYEVQVPEDKIIRAIVDSTGVVVKVATGSSIIPEKDTVLERQLKGQQISPANAQGSNVQMYVDFTPEKAEGR